MRKLLGAAALAFAVLSGAGAVQTASAVTVSDGSIFRVDFDASTAAGNVSTFLDITVDAVSATVYDLFVKVTNDTASSPGSRFSAFSFSLDPNVTSLVVSNPANAAFTDDLNGLNWAKKGGFVPGFMGREFCVGTATNCQAANAGVADGLIDRLALRLTFGSSVSAFNITDFAGRFAAIGTQDFSLGVAGTTTAVPLPASLSLLLAGLAGLGLIGRMRRAAA